MFMKIFCLFLGLTHGIALSAAVVVFLSILGIAPQLTAITGTRKFVNLYGACLGLGAIVFAAADLLKWRLSLGSLELPMLAATLLLFGIFTGVLLSALAEVFDIFPAFTSKLGIEKASNI